MATTLFRILPLAAAMMGVLAVPSLEARGRGGGGGGWHGGGGHGGHGFHHGGGHGHHHRHHRHDRFRSFNQFVDFGGWGGYGGNYYNPYADQLPVQENLIPVAPATPVQKGYATYYSADGYYNYPRFYNPGATVSQIFVNACCPQYSPRKAARRYYRPKAKPCPTHPLDVAEHLKTEKGGK